MDITIADVLPYLAGPLVGALAAVVTAAVNLEARLRRSTVADSALLEALPPRSGARAELRQSVLERTRLLVAVTRYPRFAGRDAVSIGLLVFASGLFGVGVAQSTSGGAAVESATGTSLPAILGMAAWLALLRSVSTRATARLRYIRSTNQPELLAREAEAARHWTALAGFTVLAWFAIILAGSMFTVAFSLGAPTRTLSILLIVTVMVSFVPAQWWLLNRRDQFWRDALVDRPASYTLGGEADEAADRARKLNAAPAARSGSGRTRRSRRARPPAPTDLGDRRTVSPEPEPEPEPGTAFSPG